MKTILLFIILILGISHIKADLPVHCLKKQVLGKWQAYLTAPMQAKDGQAVNCGHAAPDNEKSSWKAMQDTFETEKQFTFELNQDDTLKAEFDENNNKSGTWTMIYDEGFEMKVGDMSLFTFSKYQSNNYEFESVCDQTLVGWYDNKATGEKGCYKAEKKNSNGKATQNVKQDSVVQPKNTQTDNNSNNKQQNIDLSLNSNTQQQNKEENFISTSENYKTTKTFETEPDLELKTSEIFNDSFIFTQTKSKNHLSKNQNLRKSHNHSKNSKKIDEKLEMKKEFKDHQKVVDRLNTVQKSWKAAVPQDFSELTIEQMNRRAGNIRNKSKFEQQQKSGFVISFAQQQKKDGFEHYSRESVADLPKEFTWEEYLNNPVQQKDCGSCYAIATSEMISSRLNIKFGEKVKISAQHSLDCNAYNQGCDGGYGFLVSKWGSEYDLVPESCHPYKAFNGQCSNSCDVSKLDRTYRVEDYGYIGGAYGKSSERLMMLEMMNNGPIVVSFEPNYDFMYYDEGIYHSVDAEDWVKKHEQLPQWEKVDHSVLAYGWGEENGEKYWKILNSWGENWGEEGHFRIRRGTDESHVESMGEFAIPYIVNKK